MPGEYLWRYWAKSGGAEGYHALPAHLLDVAAVGVAYLRARPSLRDAWAEGLNLRPHQVEVLMGWALAVHDIGKFCDRFQGQHPELFARLHPGQTRRDCRPHHTTLGSLLLTRRLRRELGARFADGHLWSPSEWQYVLGALEPPFTGHHGQPPDGNVSGDPWDDKGARAAFDWLVALEGILPIRTLWRDGTTARSMLPLIRAASWHLAGFAVQCDWIGSNEDSFPATSQPQAIEEYWAGALARAEIAVGRTGILPTAVAAPITMATTFDHPPTHLQTLVEGWAPDGPQLLIIEETTGSGKTEASLIAAHRLMHAGTAEGLYFALPTQATANAMFARLQTAGPHLYAKPSEASLVLAHSGRLAMREFREVSAEAWGAGDRDEGRLACSEWLADSRKKTFLAHVGVGTLDQALLGVLAVRHQSLRLFGLTSRVLVVDEVHAYDPYATLLLATLLRFHARAGGSAILLSATMPQGLRQRLAAIYAEELDGETRAISSTAYPLLTEVSAGGIRETPLEARAQCRRTIGIAFVHDTGDVYARIRDAAAQGQAVCWIRNTVADAVEAWKVLAADGAMLLHARFMESDRRAIETSLMGWGGPKALAADRRGKILIATQVVEQSLDVDFDFMISDLAPIDLLIQRAGRLHRHADRERPGAGPPVLHVHAPAWSDTPGESWVAAWSGGTAAVYRDHGRLWLTQGELSQRGRIQIPEDARALIEAVYGPAVTATIPLGLRRATERAEADGLAEGGHAAVKVLGLDEGYAASAARWDAPERARTRAGKPSVDIHLARQGAAGPVPLAAEGDGWDGARVRVRTDQAVSAGLLDTEQPPRGRPSNIVILSDADDDSWQRSAGSGGKRFSVRYARTTGLTITEEREE